MDIETVVTLVAVIGLSYFALLSIIWSLSKQNKILHQLLRDTNREYKLYQAAVDGDYRTAGVLRGIPDGISAGAKEKPLAFEVDSVKEEPEEDETIITQRG
jgi:hypothetical protein